MQDLHKSLEPLKLGTFVDLDLKKVKKAIEGNETKVAEHFQHAVYQFCVKKSGAKVEDANIARRLVKLCYSEKCLAGLQNMERFSGCVASIASFFISKEKLDDVLVMCHLLNNKMNLLKDASISSALVRDNLFIMHHHLVEASIKQMSVQPETSILLLETSIIPLEYISIQDTKIASKTARNLKHAINNLKTLPQSSITGLLRRAKRVIRVLAGVKRDRIFEDFFTFRILSLLCAKTNLVDIEKLNAKCKSEVRILLGLIDGFGTQEDWDTIVDTFISSECSVSLGVDAVKKVMKVVDVQKEDLTRALLLVSSFFTPELWAVLHEDIPSSELTIQLFHGFATFLWDQASQCRSYILETGGTGRWKHVCLLETLAQCFLAISSLCRSCFKHKVSGCLDLVPIAVEAFKVCNVCLEEMTTNGCDGSLQKCLWASSVIRAANSIEDLVGHCLNGGAWTSLQQFCREVVPVIAVSKRELPIERKRVTLQFERWHMACISLGDHREAMTVRALQVCTCPSDIDDAILSWAKSKMAEDGTDKTVTFLDYLKRKESELRFWKTDLEISKMNRKALLLAEAKAYQAIGTDDVHVPIMKVWSILKTLRPDVFESVQVLSCLIATIVNNAEAESVAKCVRECRRLLELLSNLRDTDPEMHARCMCHEGVLKFAIFVCVARQSRDLGETPQTRDMVLQILKAEAEEKAKFGEEVDMNVTCDVIPTAGSLTVAEEATLMAALEAALAAWTPLPAIWTLDCLAPNEVVLALDHLHLIGNMAALYGHMGLTVRARMVHYQIAQLTGDQAASLMALSMLITECGAVSNSKLVATTTEIAAALQDGMEFKKMTQSTLEALLSNWLALAQTHLTYENYQAAAEVLRCCQDQVMLLRDETAYLMYKGRYLCYVSQLLLAAPHFGPLLQTLNAQREAYNSFHHLKAALKAGTEHTLNSKLQGQLLLTTLEVSLWCADLFHSLLLTPYVRAFIEGIYSICQALGLTGRTAQLLAVLVEVDLTTREQAEAQLKLSNLNAILDLPPLLNLEVKKIEPMHQLQVPSPSAPHQRQQQMSPVRCYQSMTRDTSPLPMMLPRSNREKHQYSSSCTCYSCCNVFLQLAALTARGCEAVAAAMNGEMTVAAVYHCHCHQRVNNFELDRYQDAIAREMNAVFPGENLSLIRRELCRVGVRLGINYAAFTMLPDCPSTTTTTTTILLTAAERMLPFLSHKRALLECQLLELHVCHYLLKERKKDAVTAIVAVSKNKEDVSLATKTPHVSRRRLVTGTAPKKYVAPDDMTQTPAAPPRRGRRIFESVVSTIIPQAPTETAFETPIGIQKPVKSVAASSVRVPVNSKTRTRKKKLFVIGSSSDSDVPATPSPEINSVTKRAGAVKVTNPRPIALIFDESQDTQNNVDESRDLFESFERALTISKKSEKKQKTGKVELPAKGTRKGPARTHRL